MQSEIQQDPYTQSTDPSRWALVTGASAGLGEAFCRQLAARGYHLVLVARRAERLFTLADELREQYGAASLVIPTDLSEPGSARRIASRLASKEIAVEFLVNNAGFGLPGRFTEVAWDRHEQYIQLMVTSVCELTRHLLPAMQQAGKGYVINVSSVAGLVPGSEGHTLYGASKAFLVSYSQSLAYENGRLGIRVCALCPGFTLTEFHDVNDTRSLVRQLPKWMWSDADEVARFGVNWVTRERGRTVAIPGGVNRLIVWMNRHFPALARAGMKRMSKRFRNLDKT